MTLEKESELSSIIILLKIFDVLYSFKKENLFKYISSTLKIIILSENSQVNGK